MKKPANERRASACADEKEAFAALCEHHRDRLWRIVSSVARDADAEELAQEAVVRAYCARHTYRQEAPFGAWICKIAVNVAHDYRRSGWKRKVRLWDRQPDDAPDTAIQQDAERLHLQQEVRTAVAELPQPIRVPLWLHYFEGYSVAEIARLEALPESTVRSRILSGLRRLRRSLRTRLGEDWETEDVGKVEATGWTA